MITRFLIFVLDLADLFRDNVLLPVAFAAAKEAEAGKGLPRLRGDGPYTEQGYADLLRVAPPTRGWTLDGRRERPE